MQDPQPPRDGVARSEPLPAKVIAGQPGSGSFSVQGRAHRRRPRLQSLQPLSFEVGVAHQMFTAKAENFLRHVTPPTGHEGEAVRITPIHAADRCKDATQHSSVDQSSTCFNRRGWLRAVK